METARCFRIRAFLAFRAAARADGQHVWVLFPEDAFKPIEMFFVQRLGLHHGLSIQVVFQLSGRLHEDAVPVVRDFFPGTLPECRIPAGSSSICRTYGRCWLRTSYGLPVLIRWCGSPEEQPWENPCAFASSVILFLSVIMFSILWLLTEVSFMCSYRAGRGNSSSSTKQS